MHSFNKVNKLNPTMKNVIARRLFVALTFVAFMAILFSSCNRGYGCPYKMEVKTEVKH